MLLRNIEFLVICLVYLTLFLSENYVYSLDNCDARTGANCYSRIEKHKLILRHAKAMLDIATYTRNDLKGLRAVFHHMDEIKVLQRAESDAQRSQFCGTKARSQESLASFQKWFGKNHNFAHLNLRLSTDSNGGLGLSTTKRLEGHQDMLLRINFKSTLASSEAKSELSRVFGKLKIDKPWFEPYWLELTWLALKLTMERLNNTSQLKPYLDTLPCNINHPVLFSLSDFELLYNSISYESASWNLLDGVAQYAILYDKLFNMSPSLARQINVNLDDFTLDIYLWAFAITLTRSIEDDARNYRLVPYVDFINHDSDQKSAQIRFDFTHGSCQAHKAVKHGHKEHIDGEALVVTTRQLQAGDEILFAYSDPNRTSLEQFFSFWGIVERNAFTHLKIGLNSQDALRRLKLAKLKRQNYNLNYDAFVHVHNYGRFPVPDKELPLVLLISSGTTVEKLSENAWKRMWRYLARQANVQLHMYKCSLAQCRRELKTEENQKRKLVLKQLINEQLMLANFVQNCVKMLRVPMQNDWVIPERIINKGKGDIEELEPVVKMTIPQPPASDKPLNKKAVPETAHGYQVPAGWSEDDVREIIEQWTREDTIDS